MFRKLLRQFLALLTRATLRKHHARVVAVVGDGPSAVVREYLFQAVNLMHPAVQNLEAPDVEFSVPLTILGARGYPTNLWQWLKLLVKSSVQLIWIKPFTHVLILEMATVSREVTQFWLRALSPELVVDTTDLEFNAQQLIAFVCRQLEELDVDSELAEQLLTDYQLPEARMNYYQGPAGSRVLDATHRFYPPNWESVLEIVDELKLQSQILLTDGQASSLPTELKGWQVNPLEPQLGSNTLIVLRGFGPLVKHKYQDLLA
jgi:hypothetical protein